MHQNIYMWMLSYEPQSLQQGAVIANGVQLIDCFCHVFLMVFQVLREAMPVRSAVSSNQLPLKSHATCMHMATRRVVTCQRTYSYISRHFPQLIPTYIHSSKYQPHRRHIISKVTLSKLETALQQTSQSRRVICLVEYGMLSYFRL
jgi:hypothetical protein